MNKIIEQYMRIQKERNENRSTANPLPISTILQDITNEVLVVPEFQRDFEWNLDRFTLLFDSIYRGYTIGNLLLWKTKEQLAHKMIGAEKAKPIDSISNKEYTYVLDGQQRLTTLYGILKGEKISRNGKNPKEFKIYFDIKTDEFIKETLKIEDLSQRTIKKIISDKEFDKFRFIDMSQIFNTELNFPENLIKPERDLLWEKSLLGELSKQEAQLKKIELDEKELNLRRFKEIFESYRIPQIISYNDDIDKVVTVFERINTQNMQLDIYDIMVAKTYENIIFENNKYTFNLNRTVDKILYNRELNSIYLSPIKELAEDENLYYKIYSTTLLRLISIFINKDNGIALQKNNIYNLKAQIIQNNIIEFRKIISYIHNYNKNQLNINDINEAFTNNNVLSFMTYVFSKNTYRESKTELLNLWFWNSMIFDRFPGSQLQLIEKDVLAYDKGEDSFKKIISYRRNLSILNEEYTLNGIKLIDAGYNKVNSKLYQACILLLNSLKPSDFDGKHEIDLTNYIGNNTKNNKHHIIPYNSDAGKELRHKYGKEKGEFIINNIANIAIIGSEINKEISKKSPLVYFSKYESLSNFKELLESHLIDENMYQYLKKEEFENFLIARTKKILKLITEKCNIDEEEIIFEIQDNEEEDSN